MKELYGPNTEVERYKDENFKIRHFKRGLLSLANRGPNTNSG